MTPVFDNQSAADCWTAYFVEVDSLVRLIGPKAAELRADLESHLLDSFAAQPDEWTELDRLRAAIRRLGAPEEYLRPLVADGLIQGRGRWADPAALIRGLYHASRLGAAKMIVGITFGAAYLVIWSVFVLGLLWPFWRNRIGLFQWPDGTIAFGLSERTATATNLLGGWTMPMMVLGGLCAHLLLTWLLRRVWTKI